MLYQGKIMHDKENAYIVRGAQGGIIIAILLIIIILSLNVNNFWRATSKDFIVFYLLAIILLTIVGGIAGKCYLSDKSTKLIWLIAYVVLSLAGIFQNILELKINKEMLAFLIFLAIFVVLYAESTDYIWKLWIKGIDNKYSQ